MDNNEAFEKWFLGDNIKSSLSREPKGHYTYAPANTAWNVWQAAKADSDKEIERLKAQAALDESLMAENTRTIQELEAHINELREALKGEQNKP